MSRIVKPEHVDWNWRTTDDGVPDAIVSKGGQSITPLATYTTDASGNITGLAGGFPYIYTWATRPTTGLTAGNVARFSDIGNGSIVFTWTGSKWACGAQLLYVDVVPNASVDTATGTANALSSFTLPADVLSANGYLEFDWLMEGVGSNNIAKNTRIWANSTQIFAFGATTTNGNTRYSARWQNANSKTVQRYYNQSTPWGSTQASIGSTSINTANAITFYLTAEMPAGNGSTDQYQKNYLAVMLGVY